MTAAAGLLATARQTGIRFEPRGHDLYMQAEREPPADLLASLREHKAELLAALKAEKPVAGDEKLQAMTETACEGLNLAPTELLAGLTAADREALSSESLPMLRAYALAVADTRTRERGEIPSHYTSRTICKGCGSVPIFAGCPEHVDGCPWCWNRLKGLPVPKAST